MSKSTLLSCKYCDKILKNQNAHSGHMRSCTKKNELFNIFKIKNSKIFSNADIVTKKWDEIDHSHYEYQQFESRFSNNSIQFLLNEVPVLNRFSKKRIEKYCLFYLVVLAEVGPSFKIRNKSFDLIKKLIDKQELCVILSYWNNICKHRYEPITDNYAIRWNRFVRVKDEAFFNIDYPLWLLIFDRYLPTFKFFGWEKSVHGKKIKGYYDNNFKNYY